MKLIDIIQILSMILGIFSAVAVLAFRRFGQKSWFLGSFVLLGAIVPGVCAFAGKVSIQPADWPFRLAVSALILAAPFGLLFAWEFNPPLSKRTLLQKKYLMYPLLAPVPVLTLLLWLANHAPNESYPSQDFIATGPAGYVASLYLIIVSIFSLSTLEQTVRGVDERTRWEIKFLVVGLAGSYAAIVYLASKALLYSFQYALLPKTAFSVFALLYPISCILILASWKRSSGVLRVAISQKLIYGSITLLCVGFYLIVSAVIARWANLQGMLGIEAESIVFLLSVIGLAIVLLWTGFRHRARAWIRRNFFSGRYDYRELWIEASEQIRSVDGAEKSAMALASLIQRALGAIHISVWLCEQDSERMRRVASLGDMENPPNLETKGILEKFAENADPLTEESIRKMPENAEVKLFCEQVNASVLAPLRSSGRIIGVLTVGSDRSGFAYNLEAIDFLKVLANHAASEFHKQELLSVLVAAKEAEAFKSFSTFLLHDLKNFASTLSLIAKNASRHHENPDFQRDSFKSVFEIAEKMKRLCNNLRAFSTSLAANRRDADLNQVVRSAIGGLGEDLMSQIRLELNDLPLVRLDAEEVTKVVQNLVLNANQAMNKSGFIAIRTAAQDGNVELTVEDDGKGMTKEFLEKELFLPFHTTKSDGLGIGLFHCKKIIEAHKGRICIQSEEGKGTTVSITLPVEVKTQTVNAD